jgi:cysteinyl-tRNA synthetase
MHNGFLNVDNEKMSKSLGNFFTIRDVLQHVDGQTLRFLFIRTHYRSPLNFSDAHLEDARAALKRLYTALDGVQLPPAAPGETDQIDWQQAHAAAFKAAMDEDFNAPAAIAVLFDLASEVNRSKRIEDARLLRALGGVLGLLQESPRAFLQAGTGIDEAGIQALIDQRAQAKKDRDFARADAIRDELLAVGVMLKDSPQGTTWSRA